MKLNIECDKCKTKFKDFDSHSGFFDCFEIDDLNLCEKCYKEVKNVQD